MTRAKAGTGHLQDMTLTVKRHRAVLSIDPLCMRLQGNVSLATRKQAPPPLLLDLIHAPPLQPTISQALHLAHRIMRMRIPPPAVIGLPLPTKGPKRSV